MNDEQFERRTLELLQEEAKQPIGWKWLSFADHQKCRGVFVTKAKGLLDARLQCGALSRGGEVRMIEFPSDLPAGAEELLQSFSGRLLTIEEANELNEALIALE